MRGGARGWGGRKTTREGKKERKEAADPTPRDAGLGARHVDRRRGRRGQGVGGRRAAHDRRRRRRSGEPTPRTPHSWPRGADRARGQGDVVVLDPAENGAVCVPAGRLAEVLALLPRLVAADARVLADVEAGVEVGEAFRRHRG